MTTVRSQTLGFLIAASCAIGFPSALLAQAPPREPGSTKPAESQEAGKFKRYVSQDYGWSVDYPQDWKLDSSDPASVRIHTAAGLPEGLVGIHSGTHRFGSLADAVEEFLVGYSASLNQLGLKVERVSKRDITLRDGTAAVEVVHRLGTGIEGKSKAIFAVVGKRSFLIDAESLATNWDKLEPYYDKIIASLTVAGAAKAPAPVSAVPPPTKQEEQSEENELENFMAFARHAAAAGEAVAIRIEGQGVFVFYNSPRPFCYTYMIPGDWEESDEPGIYRSKDGKTRAGVLVVSADVLSTAKGANLVKEVKDWITKYYEKALGARPADVQLAPFESVELRVWKWMAAPLKKGDLNIELPTTLIVDLSPDAVVVILVVGAQDDEALSRQVLASLRTTKNPDCYLFPLGQFARELFP